MLFDAAFNCQRTAYLFTMFIEGNFRFTMLCILAAIALTVDCLEPTFDVPIVNVTVVRGQIALLPCSIDLLGKYKVAWLDESSIPLTYDDRRTVDDSRFTIVRPIVREWNLQIRDVRLEDQGQYRCTVNTQPVRSKVVMLHVKAPAEFIPDLSSGDVTLQEGDSVVLTCNVTGIPQPQVTWYRRTSSAFKYGFNYHDHRLRTAEGVGESITIRNVTRNSDDVYECLATNGVPPPAIRHIRVTVEFPPEIQLLNRRIGQSRGRETILECVITAYPQALTYWMKDGRHLPTSSKHRIEAYDQGEHKLTLSIRIHDVGEDDFGEYICYASNSLGVVQQSMYLYEYSSESSNIQSTQRLLGSLDSRSTTLNSETNLHPLLSVSSTADISYNGMRKDAQPYWYTSSSAEFANEKTMSQSRKPSAAVPFDAVNSDHSWTEHNIRQAPLENRLTGGACSKINDSKWVMMFLIFLKFSILSNVIV